LTRVLRFVRSVVVADLGAIGLPLTPVGEPEVLGHVAHSLASWRTRATAGEAAQPWSWAVLSSPSCGLRGRPDTRESDS
jgi:hypothetical protein